MANDNQCVPERPCVTVQRILDFQEAWERQRKEDLERDKEWQKGVEKCLYRLQNRLPLWATFLIAALTSAVGKLWG